MSHVEWDQNVCSPGLNFRKNSFHCVTCPFYSNCWKMIKIRICLRKIKINDTYAIAQKSNLLSTNLIFLSCTKLWDSYDDVLCVLQSTYNSKGCYSTLSKPDIEINVVSRFLYEKNQLVKDYLFLCLAPERSYSCQA